MKFIKARLGCIAVCAALIGTVAITPSAYADTPDTTADKKAELVETGYILEPEKIQTIGMEDAGSAKIGTTIGRQQSEELQPSQNALLEEASSPAVKVAWQNPKYANLTRGVYGSACSGSNYRVISKASLGTIPVRYTYSYQCYAGRGRVSFRMLPQIGYVIRLCPGNNRNASIWFTNTMTQDRRWYWSDRRHPPTASNWQCYTFSGDNEGYYQGVRYTGVSLNE